MMNCLTPIVIDLGWTVEFRKDSLANFKWITCLEFARADGVRLRAIVFFWPFGFTVAVWLRLCYFYLPKTIGDERQMVVLTKDDR
jgi:hypothetical protein